MGFLEVSPIQVGSLVLRSIHSQILQNDLIPAPGGRSVKIVSSANSPSVFEAAGSCARSPSPTWTNS